MISITLSQAAAVLQGALHGQDLTIEAVTTDTRKVTAGCLFVALKGERFDAHDFAQQAKDNGAGALLVSRKLDIDLPCGERYAPGVWRAGGMGSPAGTDSRRGADGLVGQNLR